MNTRKKSAFLGKRYARGTLWPVLGNSVSKLGQEFLLLWIHFHSFSINSYYQRSKNCGLCAKFWNIWNWNKIEPAGAKFRAWVLGQEFSKPTIVNCMRLKLRNLNLGSESSINSCTEGSELCIKHKCMKDQLLRP